ncbi:uncharacterized protein LOC119744676 [Patiria miniata]|uniref:Ig-like domain-containing protein n=1 Tax=Patiria miniata TaxID=46514 RepID=A0A914BMG7_PATMI|nr:uncharacterized protein LOC119744676 [Patiria miniata]
MYPLTWRCVISQVRTFLVLSPMIFHRHAFAQISVDQGPTDVAVVQGGTATFVCDLSKVTGYKIYWYYLEGSLARYLSIGRAVGVSTPLSSDLLSRLSIIGDESREEFTLRITNVRATDSGAYSCLYAHDGGSLQTAGAGRLTVLIPPSMESPVCVVEGTSGTADHFDVGALISLYCYTSGGDPSPTVVYYRDGERLTGLARSIGHQYRLAAEDNGVVFTCVMTTPALDESRNCSVTPLRILPQATILPALSRVEEGTSASFQCNGEGVPSIVKFRWRVTNVDTGLVLPAERYFITKNGRSLEIAVKENIDLLCIVSVPSGLSGNTTVRVEVIKREFSTMAVQSTVEQRASREPSTSSPPVAIIVVVVVLALVTIGLVTVVWFLRKRKQQRRSKIPIDPKDGHNMSDMATEYAEIGRPTQNSLTPDAGLHQAGIVMAATGGGLVASNPLYALPDNRVRVGSMGRSEQSSSPDMKPDKKRATNNNDETMPATTANDDDADGTLTRLLPADTPQYAQLDKSKKTRKSGEHTGIEYSAVPAEEPQEADSGLVYADLDLDSSSPSITENTGLPSASEKTVYATIHT